MGWSFKEVFFLHGIEVLGVMANTKVVKSDRPSSHTRWSGKWPYWKTKKRNKSWGNSFATSMILGGRVPFVLSKVLAAWISCELSTFFSTFVTGLLFTTTKIWITSDKKGWNLLFHSWCPVKRAKIGCSSCRGSSPPVPSGRVDGGYRDNGCLVKLGCLSFFCFGVVFWII